MKKITIYLMMFLFVVSLAYSTHWKSYVDAGTSGSMYDDFNRINNHTIGGIWENTTIDYTPSNVWGGVWIETYTMYGGCGWPTAEDIAPISEKLNASENLTIQFDVIDVSQSGNQRVGFMFCDSDVSNSSYLYNKQFPNSNCTGYSFNDAVGTRWYNTTQPELSQDLYIGGVGRTESDINNGDHVTIFLNYTNISIWVNGFMLHSSEIITDGTSGFNGFDIRDGVWVVYNSLCSGGYYNTHLDNFILNYTVTTESDCTQYPDAPLGLWRFEEGGGSIAVDNSGNLNYGDIYNAEHTASSGTNSTGDYSLLFDGLTDWVNADNSNDNFTFGNSVTDKPFSIGAWIYMDSSDVFRVMSKFDGTSDGEVEWYLNTDGSHRLSFALADYNNANIIFKKTDSLLGSVSEWIFVTATYNGNSDIDGLNIYVDGVESSYTNGSSGSYLAMHDNNLDVEIGSALDGGSLADGRIDEAFIIDKKLSQEEIIQIMNCGWDEFEPEYPSEIDLHLELPENNTVIEGVDADFIYFINYSEANTKLYINDSLYDTYISDYGNNTVSLTDFVNVTLRWKVNVSFGEIHNFESETWILAFNQTTPPTAQVEPVPEFAIDRHSCVFAEGSLGEIIGIVFLFLLAGAVICAGWIMRQAITGTIGGAILMLASIYLWYCFQLVAFIMTLFSLWIMWYFLSNGYRGRL